MDSVNSFPRIIALITFEVATIYAVWYCLVAYGTLCPLNYLLAGFCGVPMFLFCYAIDLERQRKSPESEGRHQFDDRKFKEG